jgi:hypothetical protein
MAAAILVAVVVTLIPLARRRERPARAMYDD